MWTEIEAARVEKHVKMLTHYLHHFGQVRNVIFRVERYWITGTTNPVEYEVRIRIQPAKSFIFDKSQQKQMPKAHDCEKLCLHLELCPDIVVIDKKITQHLSGIHDITYKVESINFALDFIRSDHFK